jgi:PIN domain nuclease of toxin-antitoxin system
VRVLLDTHLLLWALSQPSKLSTATRKQIVAAEVYVSAASIWEVSIKSALGKLAAKASDVLAGIEPAGFGRPMLHQDPFDRMLVAQASVEPMLLLTNDETLRGYGSFVTVG